MRFLAFASLGMVLGYLYLSWVRRALGSVSSNRMPPGRRAVAEMLLRLVAFALVLGLLLYRFGPLSGVAALVGAVLSRSLMARSGLELRGH